MTAGLDGRISTDLKAGFAIGFGANHTSVGTDGTSSDANNVSGTAYASYHPYGSIYFDALAGYGAARFRPIASARCRGFLSLARARARKSTARSR